MIPVLVSQATASKRRMFWHLVGPDGITPVTGETGQPQISHSGAAFTATGIGAVVEIGQGAYYAELTAAAVATAGDVIRGRYKSANTAECPAHELVRVVAYDPDDAAALGLSRLDTAVTTRAAQTDATAIKAKTDQIAFTTPGKVDAAIQGAADFAQAAADKVWGTASRTLTAFGFAVDLSAAAVTAVWSAASRTLTAGVDLTAGAIASAAAAVWDVLVSTLTTAGSIGKYIVDQLAVAGGDPLNSQVPGSYPSGSAGAALGRIGAVSVQVISPWSATDGKLRLTRGDSYEGADAIDFIDSEGHWPEPLTAATFTARRGGAAALTKAIEIVTASGPEKRVRLELTSAETAALVPGTPAYRFDIEVQGGGQTKTPEIGTIDVFEDQTRA